jgi:predicted Rossmann fold nucleotide-binding protein DprA/Smf involved in DNA uptake
MPWQAEADGWFAVDALAARGARGAVAGGGLEAPDPEAARAELTGAEARLYDLITPEPEHVDLLAARASLEPALVLAALSALELQGLITQRPGKHFVLAS